MDAMPATYRYLGEVYEGLRSYQKKLEDPSNRFFKTNKLSPWMRVTVQRGLEIECQNTDGVCYSQDLLDENDFDGAPYREHAGPTMKTLYGHFTPHGNTKDVKIVDDEGNIIWEKVL